MKSAPELITELQAEVERLERVNRSLISEQRSSAAEQRGAIKTALKPYADTERALWWLLAQVQSEPRPARHDDDCWLRHLHCFAEKLRLKGGPLAVAQELQWSRQRAADRRVLTERADGAARCCNAHHFEGCADGEPGCCPQCSINPWPAERADRRTT